MLTFGSLFAGIGGFDLGFERAGLTCKWQVEINEYAQKVLAKHWPEVHRWDDVRTWPQPGAEQVDCIVGGFPCQDISYAGPGLGLAGERSGLWFEFARIICEMEPRFVVVENVSALLTRGLDSVLGTLAAVGYDAEWDCVPACAFGAPHIRDRIWIIGQRRTSSNTKMQHRARQDAATHEPRRLRPTVSNTNSKRWVKRRNDNAKYDGSEPTTICQHTQKIPDTMCKGLEIGQRQNSSRTRPNSRSVITRSDWWAVEPDVGRVAYGIPNRVDRLKGLGNAVVPQIAEWIGRRILERVQHGT